MNLKYIEIENIEEVGIEDVYDIQMEDNPSFIANEIVVHNCGMRKLLQDLARTEDLTFDDLVATTALFRPGPIDSGMLDEYVQIKQGAREPEYPHPSVEKVLQETKGVLIYQEETMGIAKELCGFSGAETDHLRKAIGKKDTDKMAEMKDKFIAGAIAGFIDVELDNGELKRFHRLAKLSVRENKDLWTIEEIFKNNFTLLV